MPTYTVHVNDNFHYMDESERYKLRDFDDCQSAIAACKKMVDEFLAACDANRTAEELYQQYTMFGEDPWISADDPRLQILRLELRQRTLPRACPQALDKPLEGKH